METLHINLQMDNVTECLSRLKVAFSSCIMPTQAFLDPASNIAQLTCTVPSWSLTQSGDKTINLYVIVTSDQPHQVLDAWPVGYFTYQSKKRSSSNLLLDYNTIMMKRIKSPAGSSSIDRVTDQETQTQRLPAGDFMLSNQQGIDYNYYGLHQHYIQSTTTVTSSTDRSRQYYDDSTSPSHNMLPHKPTTTTDSINDSLGLSPENMDKMTTPGEPPHDFTDPNTTYDMSSSPLQPPSIPEMTSPLDVPATTISASGAVTPPYQLQQHHHHHLSPFPSLGQQHHPLPSVSAATSAATSSANLYANLLSNADLVIEGNMDDMMRHWTDQEQQDHRRLVRLWRRQREHEIICNFQAVPPTNQMNSPQEIIVSCIYWEHKDDYFITSVDLIYLLESLIGIRFTTEEKNRVRRNLEGFCPLTVSKFKPDSSDFFKLIMAFNHPKPRNIEKDLKVFAWPSLPNALKKIISKYSASYSSTASVNLDAHTI